MLNDTVLQTVNARLLNTVAGAGEASKQVLRYLEEIGGHGRFKNGTTAILKGRFVDLDSSELLALAPNASFDRLGVLDTDTPGLGGSLYGKVRLSGRAEVMCASDVSAGSKIVCTAEGFGGIYQTADHSLASAKAGADASDDIDQTNLPDQVSIICAGDETGNTVIIYGKVGTTYTVETVTLGAAATYTSSATFAAVYCLETTAESVGTIDIKDATLTGLLIPQIAATTAARKYGAIVPDDSTDSKGQKPVIKAGGANTSEVVLYGTDYNGDAQAEVVTMTGTTYVASTHAWRSVSHIFIGADGIAFNAGVTSQYTATILKNSTSDVRAVALLANSTDGKMSQVFLVPQSRKTYIIHSELYTTAGGAAAEAITLPGVAATDIAFVTMIDNGTNNVTFAADATAVCSSGAVTVTFSGDPSSDTIIALLVIRP